MTNPLDLHFVMDLPLTIYKTHGWATKNHAKKTNETGKDDIYVVDLNDEVVYGTLLSAAKKYLSWGVDGFYFSEYRATKVV